MTDADIRSLTETVAGALSAPTSGTAEVSDSFGQTIASVPREHWIAALTAARDDLGATFFDWLTGVDELEAGYTVTAHVCAPAGGPSDATPLMRGEGFLLKTRVPREDAVLASATGVYRGANWHERETFEMFGIEFTGHPDLKPLLLPDGFEGHPLRKDFILAARVAKAWPGAKEPGESDRDHDRDRDRDRDRGKASPGRRRMLPPGVPGEDWLKPLAAPTSKTPTSPVAEAPDLPSDAAHEDHDPGAGQ